MSFILDIDNSGYVSDFELQELFREASFHLPGYKVREIVETFIAGDTNKDEKISFEEFVVVSLIMILSWSVDEFLLVFIICIKYTSAARVTVALWKLRSH